MKNKHLDILDIKELIAIIAILLGGAALTATSFCVYYLVEPLHPAVLVVICVFDFFIPYYARAYYLSMGHSGESGC